MSSRGIYFCWLPNKKPQRQNDWAKGYSYSKLPLLWTLSMGLWFSVHNSKILILEKLHLYVYRLQNQLQYSVCIETLISNKTNRNRTELAFLFRSPQAGLGLAIAVIYKIYGVKKLFFGKTRQGAKKVSFTACHSGKL